MSFESDFRFFGLDLNRRGYPHDMLGKYEGKRCIVAASAACVWDDLERLGVNNVNPEGRFNDWHIIAVNDMIMYFPGIIDHCYSNQHRWFAGWLGARRETICKVHVKSKWGEPGPTHSCRVGGKYNWPWPGHGTSTLNAVYTAIALGYNPIVICGAPLDNSPHFFEPPWGHSNFEREVSITTSGEVAYWENARNKLFRGRVCSMSGRTRDLLGEYTP